MKEYYNEYIKAYDFVALQTITPGTELRFDYATAEYEIGNFPYKCLCSENACRSQIRGFKHSDKILRKQYGDYIAEYLNTEPTNVQSADNETPSADILHRPEGFLDR